MVSWQASAQSIASEGWLKDARSKPFVLSTCRKESVGRCEASATEKGESYGKLFCAWFHTLDFLASEVARNGFPMYKIWEEQAQQQVLRMGCKHYCQS